MLQRIAQNRFDGRLDLLKRDRQNALRPAEMITPISRARIACVMILDDSRGEADFTSGPRPPNFGARRAEDDNRRPSQRRCHVSRAAVVAGKQTSPRKRRRKLAQCGAPEPPNRRTMRALNGIKRGRFTWPG